MYDKSQAVVYEDEAGNYVTSVELHSLVKSGLLSFIKQTDEKNVMRDQDGNQRVFRRTADTPDELDGYNPDTESYAEQVDWI